MDLLKIKIGIEHSNVRIQTKNYRHNAIKNPHDKYTGTSPKQAAGKVFGTVLHKLKKNNYAIPNSIIIYLREITVGSTYNFFAYECTREKLP